MADKKKTGQDEATEETASEETQEGAQAEETAEETEGTKEESAEEESEGSAEETEGSAADVDYDEIAAEAQGESQGPKPKTELEKAKFKRDQIDARIKELEGDGEDETSSGMSPEEIANRVRRELQEDRAVELVGTISKNPKEQAAILAAWKAGWTKKPGNLIDQLLDVQAVINRRRAGQMAELKSQQGTAAKSVSTAGRKLPAGQDEPKLSPELQKIMRGSKWVKGKGVWRLPNGTEINPKSLGA